MADKLMDSFQTNYSPLRSNRNSLLSSERRRLCGNPRVQDFANTKLDGGGGEKEPF